MRADQHHVQEPSARLALAKNFGRDLVRLTVVEQAQERRDVEAVGRDVEGVDAGERPPKQGADAARVDGGEGVEGACKQPVHIKLYLAVSAAGARARVGLEVLVGHVGVPELLAAVA